ncbi:unnamed protein product [Amoebophrya sp. A120]|nr:unnamed protein product [Amoebophrya sp. A120]|eukprot:GSA120T00013720001.1
MRARLQFRGCAAIAGAVSLIWLALSKDPQTAPGDRGARRGLFCPGNGPKCRSGAGKPSDDGKERRRARAGGDVGGGSRSLADFAGRAGGGRQADEGGDVFHPDTGGAPLGHCKQFELNRGDSYENPGGCKCHPPRSPGAFLGRPSAPLDREVGRTLRAERTASSGAGIGLAIGGAFDRRRHCWAWPAGLAYRQACRCGRVALSAVLWRCHGGRFFPPFMDMGRSRAGHLGRPIGAE